LHSRVLAASLVTGCMCPPGHFQLCAPLRLVLFTKLEQTCCVLWFSVTLAVNCFQFISVLCVLLVCNCSVLDWFMFACFSLSLSLSLSLYIYMTTWWVGIHNYNKTHTYFGSPPGFVAKSKPKQKPVKRPDAWKWRKVKLEDDVHDQSAQASSLTSLASCCFVAFALNGQTLISISW